MREATAYEYSLPRAIKTSIHASHEGSDEIKKEFVNGFNELQSTLPMREATILKKAYARGLDDFNPRFP